MIASTFLIASIGLIATVQSANITLPTPCLKLRPSNNGGQLAGIETLLECYNQVPFNATSRSDLVNVFKTTIQFHSLLPYLKQQDPGLDPVKDWIQIIEDESITTRFSLGAQIAEHGRKTFLKGLLGFDDFCFSYPSAYQPFDVGLPTGAASGSPIIKDVALVDSQRGSSVAKLLAEFWMTKSNLDASKYIGYSIQSINRQDAYDFFQNLHGVRADQLSEIFSTYYVNNGSWYYQASAVNYLTSFDVLRAKPMTYELKGPSGDTVTLADIPWAVLPTYTADDPTFQDFFDFFGPECFGIQAQSSTPAAWHDNHASFPVENRRKLVPGTKVVPASDEIKAPVGQPNQGLGSRLFERDASSLQLLPFQNQTRTRVFKLDDKTLVLPLSDGTLRVGSVLRPDQDVYPDTLDAYRELDAALADAVKAAPGATRLIIDISGGYLRCAGHAFLKYLFGSFKGLEHAIQLTPEVKEIISASTKNQLERNYDEEYLKPMSGSSILTNIQTLALPGSPTYSARFTRSHCDPFASKVVSNMTRFKGGWNAQNVAILSDGVAYDFNTQEFIKIASEQFGIKTHIYGTNGVARPVLEQILFLLYPTYLFEYVATSPTFKSVATADKNFNFWIPAYATFSPGSDANAQPLLQELKADVVLQSHSGDYPLGVWREAAAVMSGALDKSSPGGFGSGSGSELQKEEIYNVLERKYSATVSAREL
ncbi:hypothetical protein HDU97_007718 [Phlyctochytrium planicorne]|nr:hypothetical protein HDU97_007718 [Phlyctochytrium planicorne]